MVCALLALLGCQEPVRDPVGIVTPPPASPPPTSQPRLHTIHDPFAVGDTVMHIAFGGAGRDSAWEHAGNAIVEQVVTDGERVLRFRCPTADRCSGYATRALTARRTANAHIVLEAEVRGKGITPPIEPWNGVKVALLRGVGASELWRQASAPSGDFGWQTVRAVMEMPAAVDTARVLLGLEIARGELDIRSVTVRVIARRRPDGLARGLWSAPFPGLDGPRLRGAMTDSRNRISVLTPLGTDWKANVVRWQLRPGMVRESTDPALLADYPRALELTFAALDAALPALRDAGLWVLVDLHVPPGGHERVAGGGYRLFQEPALQQAFVDAWARMAERYRGVPNIWGFELLNEPIEGMVDPDVLHWRALAIEAVRRIREVDPTRIVVMPPAGGGGPAGLDFLEPLPFAGVAYSVHLYEPGGFTHQGIDGRPTGVTYPGVIDGQQWDASALARTLDPVDRYMRDYGVRVLVTEFGTVRGTPGESGTAWYQDMLSLLETRGLDWMFHAYREAPVFSVETETGGNARLSTAPMTGREAAIRRLFEENVRPQWGP